MEPQVWAQPIEYAVGATTWMSDAISTLSVELHPLLAEVQREQVSDLVRPEEHSQETASLASPLYRGLPVEHRVHIDLDAVLEGDVAQYLSALFEMADEFGSQLVAGMFKHISDVSDKYGQTVDVAGRDFVDAYIESLESLEMSFDENGSPTTKIYVNPNNVDFLVKNQPTLEQQERIDTIINRKREEWNAARRRQDLP